MPEDIGTDEGFQAALEGRARAQAQARIPVAQGPTEPTEPAEPAEPVEQPLVFGRFKSIEEADKSFKNLEQLLGRQANELGELRKLAAQHTQPTFGGVPDEAIEQNPAAAAQWALQRGEDLVYERAMDYWYETDPKNAARFEMRSYISTAVSPLEQQAGNSGLENAISSLRTRHDNFDEAWPRMLEAAQERPWLLENLNSTSGSRQQKETILEDLYALSSGAGQAPGTPETKPEIKKGEKAPYTETGGGTVPPKGPRTAQDVLRDQFFGTEPHILDRGIRREE